MCSKQKIDDVLFYLQEKNKSGITNIGHNNIVNHFKEDNITSLSIDDILMKLIKDQLLDRIEQVDSQPTYRITYDGLYFKGYQNKERREATSALFQTLMLILTTLGTVAAGFYALSEVICSEIYRLVLFSILLSFVCTGILFLLYTRYFQRK